MLWIKHVGAALVLATLTGIFSGSAALAQGKLKNIKEFTLIVEDLNDEARTCGITVDDIRKSATYPTISRGFSIADNANAPRWYIAILTAALQSGCVTTVRSQVYANQYVQLEASSQRIFTSVELWERTVLLTGPRNAHGKQVRDEIEDLAKKLVVDWAKDQR